MTNTNYGIDDGDGNQITTGLPSHTARRTAQRMANERGKTLYLYELGSDVEAEAIEPDAADLARDAAALDPSIDDGSGTLRIIAEQAIRDGEGTPDRVVEIAREATADAKLEADRERDA